MSLVRSPETPPLDLEHIDSWSLWLDVKILVRTVWVVLAGAGAL